MSHELIFYKPPTGEQRIEVVYEDENFWMTQKALADLFAVGIPAINKHLKNIYETGELDPEATLSKMEIVRHPAWCMSRLGFAGPCRLEVATCLLYNLQTTKRRDDASTIIS